MKFGIIAGSHQKASQSAKVANKLASLIEQREHQVWIMDLGKEPLPMWDEDIGSGEGKWAFVSEMNQQLADCDGFIFISPEWHGMATAALKNFFLVATAGQGLAHKPALLCSVSVVDGGAYVIAELRASSYKNNRICYLPEQLVYRNVGEIFNEDPSKNNPETHSYFIERSEYCVDLLIEYGRAFTQIRSSNVIDHKKYGNGM